MKYVKKAVCPPILQKWLTLINSVPPNIGIYQSWRILLCEAYFELTGEDITLLESSTSEKYDLDFHPKTFEQSKMMAIAVTKATKLLKKKSKVFPKLYVYLFVMASMHEFSDVFDETPLEKMYENYARSAPYRYKHFLQMLEDIRGIAQICMEYRQKGYFVDHEVIAEKLGFRNRNKKYGLDLIIKNGVIDFESELIQVIRGVDAERLRICPICARVYWARRIESNTCSDKRCSNNFHQRKLRITEYEKRLKTALKADEKQSSYLSSSNSLLNRQKQIIKRLEEKILREKMKNGIFPSVDNPLVEEARKRKWLGKFPKKIK